MQVAWSAAFISYVIKEAGVNSHNSSEIMLFIHKKLEKVSRKRVMLDPWAAKNPEYNSIKYVGDIVVKNRTGNTLTYKINMGILIHGKDLVTTWWI